MASRSQCSHCATALPSGANYCPECGAPHALITVDPLGGDDPPPITGTDVAPHARLRMLAGLVVVIAMLVFVWSLAREGDPPDEGPLSTETPDEGILAADPSTTVVTTTASATTGALTTASEQLVVNDDELESDDYAFERGTITASINGIDHAAASFLAGVLYQSEPGIANAIGGFGVEVDSDSFTTRQIVREPQLNPDYNNTLFPYVSAEPLVLESDNYYLQLWFAASEMGPDSRWLPAATEGLRGCQMQFSIETGTAVQVSVTKVPSAGREARLTCPAVSWETISSSSRLQEEEGWTIALNDYGPGIHSVWMIRSFSPLRAADVQELGGRLVWEQTEIELCRIAIRSVGDGSLQIGDRFQTTEGCGTNTGMQQAFDDFGLPDTACVYFRENGGDVEYCAPLAVE